MKSASRIDVPSASRENENASELEVNLQSPKPLSDIDLEIS